MAKKGMALLVAALIVWATAAPMVGAATNPFRDVPADHWAYDAIARLAEVGLVEGYPDGTFGGDRTFTRYEMAMVFARTLARMEQLIDERIQSHIGHLQDQIDALRALREQDMEATRQAIDQARRELAANLGARIDRLEQEMAELRAQAVLAPPSVSEEVSQLLEEMEVELTPQAEAALERVITERVREVVSELPDRPEIVERLREVIREQGDDVTEREIIRIVDEAVARELEELVELEDALVAVQGDTDTLWQVVGSRTDQLDGSIRRLATEFRDELDRLGIEVADLSDRVANLEEAVLMTRRDAEEARRAAETAQETASEALARTEALEKRTKFSGSVSVEADVRGFQGNETHQRFGHVPGYLLDPRHADRDKPEDIDDEDLLFHRTRVRQVFNLMAETQLDSGLAVDAKFGLFNDSLLDIKRDSNHGPEDVEGLGVDTIQVGVTGDEVSAELYYGLLNKDRIGSGFNKYVLDPDRFIEADPVREDHRGMVLTGSTGNVSGTIITLNRDHHFDTSPGHDNSGFDTKPGRRYALSGTVGLAHGWSLTGALSTFQDKDDTHSLASAQLAGPLGDLRTSLIVAQDLRHQAGAVEVGVGAQLGSVDLGLAYGAVAENYGGAAGKADRLSFMGDDDIKDDQRWYSADAKTQLVGIDLRGRHHNIVDDNSFTRFDAGYTFDLSLPVRIDATVANRAKSAGGTDNHTHVKVGWKDYALSANLGWDLSYEILNGYEFDDKDDDWKKDDPWDKDRKDKNTLDTRLTWRALDDFTLYGGYKNVQDNVKDGTENYVTAGVEYGVGDPSAARLILGYEIQTASVDKEPEDRTTRHTLKVGVNHRVFGKGNLRLEAKRITGAGDDGAEYNDAVDHVALLSLDYPVGDNLNLVVRGRYVDSDGYERTTPDGPERENYSVSEIKAGVNFSF